MEVIDIAGAGISGLTAAIHLAKNGFRARVYEKARDVGSRFRGDFQALENWTGDGDVLSLLEGMGIPPHFYHRPFKDAEVIDALGRMYTIRTNGETGIYIVRRGGERDCLDQYLKRVALEAGVEIQFGRPAEDREVRIVAKGPQFIRGVAHGITADVDCPDRIVVFLDDRIAPKAYAYLVIVDGKMTVASFLMEQFHRAKDCLAGTLERVKGIYGITPENARPMGGIIDFSMRSSYVDNGRICVGEYGGLQDYLFGFGMRYAFVSGYLAARSIIGGVGYDELVKGEMTNCLKASVVNRYIFEKMGNRGYRRLIHQLLRSGDILRFMKNWCGWRWHKGLIFPLARRWFERKKNFASSGPAGLRQSGWADKLPFEAGFDAHS